jgi:hypothetical protein
MVGVEGVSVGMGQDDIWSQVGHELDQLVKGLIIHPEGIIAQVETLKGRAYGFGSTGGLFVADLFDPLHGLSWFLPQFARLTTLTIRQGHDCSTASVRRGHCNRAGGAPDKIGGMGADYQKFASCAHTSSFVILLILCQL